MGVLGNWDGLSDELIAEQWLIESQDKKAPRGAIFAVIDLSYNDPERCWAITLAILERINEDDGLLLANVGAGPLEDLLHRFGPAFIERFIVQARRDRRFREAASCIWPSSSMDKGIWERLRVVVQPHEEAPKKRRASRW
jgi:hypothetical protein